MTISPLTTLVASVFAPSAARTAENLGESATSFLAGLVDLVQPAEGDSVDNDEEDPTQQLQALTDSLVEQIRDILQRNNVSPWSTFQLQEDGFGGLEVTGGEDEDLSALASDPELQAAFRQLADHYRQLAALQKLGTSATVDSAAALDELFQRSGGRFQLTVNRSEHQFAVQRTAA